MSEIIRVLHCFERMNRGGAESFAMNVYRKIDREKIQFDFLVSGEGAYDEEIKSLGGRIYYISPLLKVGPVRFSKELYNFFEKDKEHKIVHSHRNKVSGLILREAKKAGITIRISHSHTTSDRGNSIIKLMKNHYQKYVMKYSNCKIACGVEAAKYLYGDIADVTIINNGICSENYKYSAEIREKKRKELNLENKFVVGTTGRLETVKNHLFLLDVFNVIHKKCKNSMLLIIGSGSLKENIIEKAKKLGIENNLIVLENRCDVNEILLAMDSFVLPSLYEGVPLSAIEAQCTGLNCFLSDKVTYESKVTDLVEFIPLEETVDIWAEKILSKKGSNRKQRDEDIKLAGYDIQDGARTLEKLYRDMYNNI